MELDKELDKSDYLIMEKIAPSLELPADKPLDDPNKEMEDKILWKMDVFIVPALSVVYFISALDKSNIGNVELAGLSTSTKLVDNQYGNIVTVFYASYIFFEPLMANLLNIIGPRYMLSFGLFFYGIVTLGTAFVKNYHQLIALRVLLGFFESSVYPCINMYLTICYRRSQLAIRFSYVFLASCLASGFGGLIGFACSHLDGVHGLKGWSWIYIVEASITLGFIPYVYFMINQNLEDSWFFTDSERKYVIERYKTLDTYNREEKFSFQEVMRGIKDIKTWISAGIQFCVNLTSYGMGVFMPIIIKGMGFSSVRAQLMTVPVYFVTAISFLIFARLSDKLFCRSPFILGSCLVEVIGISLVMTDRFNSVRFLGVFILALGLYITTSMNVVWLNSNSGNYYKRATSVGFNQLIGNSTGLVSGQIFRSQDSPKYRLGLAICLGGQVLAIGLVMVELIYLRMINRQRSRDLVDAKMKGIELPKRSDLGDDDIYFRYVY